MDRLQAVRSVAVAAAVLLVACKREEPARMTRYEAVKPASQAVNSWCDTSFPSGGPALSLPPQSPGAGAKGLRKGKPAWVNLWATWCAPCLREMPLLLSWQKDLAKDGVDADLWLVSVDDDDAELSEFLAKHKEIPAARVLRVSSQAEYATWLKTYSADPSASIPIHLLAGSDGKARCLRVGSLRESDYPNARSLLK